MEQREMDKTPITPYRTIHGIAESGQGQQPRPNNVTVSYNVDRLRTNAEPAGVLRLR